MSKTARNPKFLNENDPSKFVEKDIMKSDFNNNVLNKLQSTNTSTESALLKFNDKLDKIDKFESIFSKKIEYVMLEMKNVKESIKSKFEFKVEKCQNDKDAVLDHKTNNYIQKLETKLLEKENFIKSQNDEIEKLREMANMSEQFCNYNQEILYQKLNLEEKLSIKDKSLGECEKSNIKYQQDIEVLINLLRKTFPKIKDIDSDLDNAAVIKIIENFIEEQNSESIKYESAFEQFKKELSNKDKIVKDKENEIESLENYISQYESNRIENEKSLKDIRKIFNREQQSVESQVVSINSLNCQIKVIENDLESSKSKVEDSNKHVSILEEENKQLKETIKSLEDSKFQIEATISNQRAVDLDKPFDLKKEQISIMDNITRGNSNKGAENYYDEKTFGYFAQDFYEYEEVDEYEEEVDEYDEEFDEYANIEYAYDCAFEVEEKDDLYNLMVTNKKIAVHEVCTSLSHEEYGKILDFMSTEKNNMYKALKHFDYIS